jgi:hypothetical protein
MYGFVNEEMGFRTIQILTGLSAFGSILQDFLETDVGKCEGRTFG